MKAKELMIGDWVHNQTHLFGVPYGEDIQVINVYDGLINHEFGEMGIAIGYQLNECYPIPLTAEILEKNGFVGEHPASYQNLDLNKDGSLWLEFYWYENRLSRKWYGIDEWQNHKECEEVTFKCDCIHYVHELQHALRLCGLDELADNFKV